MIGEKCAAMVLEDATATGTGGLKSGQRNERAA
jgi:hypothetical protein